MAFFCLESFAYRYMLLFCHRGCQKYALPRKASPSALLPPTGSLLFLAAMFTKGANRPSIVRPCVISLTKEMGRAKSPGVSRLAVPPFIESWNCKCILIARRYVCLLRMHCPWSCCESCQNRWLKAALQKMGYQKWG
jgi:hypothetical protein